LQNPDFSPIQQDLTGGKQVAVGSRARRLLRRIVLADHSKDGLLRLLDQFGARPFISLLRIYPLLKLVGPKARRDLGLPLSTQAWGLLQTVLVHGAKPAVYYMSELYKPELMRDAGTLVMRNEIKHGIGKALNRIDPDWLKYRRNLGDKLEAAKWCAEHNFPHPQPLILVEDGKAVMQTARQEDLDRDLWVKRRDGRGAYGATPYKRVAPFQYQDPKGRAFTLQQITEDLLQRVPVRAWMVVPQLHTHPELADLTGESLLTFRALTCLDERMRPVITNLYLRSISKLEPRWKAGIGRIEEYGAPIDLATGTLGQITADKPECLSEWFDDHPVTHARVTGRTVPFWREMAELAVKAHATLPGRVFIGWDLAVTADGPVILEGNSFADPLFPQRVFRKPWGHMRLGELLNFHLGRIEAQLDKR
jgi:hypothetical protein